MRGLQLSLPPQLIAMLSTLDFVDDHEIAGRRPDESSGDAAPDRPLQSTCTMGADDHQIRLVALDGCDDNLKWHAAKTFLFDHIWLDRAEIGSL